MLVRGVVSWWLAFGERWVRVLGVVRWLEKRVKDRGGSMDDHVA